MKAKLKNILNEMSAVEFGHLAFCVGIADMVGGILKEHKISIEDFSAICEMSLEESYTFLRGTHKYDLETISKVEVGLGKIFGKEIIEIVKINK